MAIQAAHSSGVHLAADKGRKLIVFVAHLSGNDDPLADRLAFVLARQIVIARLDLIVAEDGTGQLDGVRVDIAMMRTPDGNGRLELTKFHTPAAVRPAP